MPPCPHLLPTDGLYKICSSTFTEVLSMSNKLKSQPNNTFPETVANFDRLPDSAYVRLAVVMILYGVSASTVWRNSSKSKKLIPAPIKLSERCTAWNVGQLRASLASKVGA